MDDAGRAEDGFAAEGGVVTAGNASQISDGSAALLMTTAERAAGARADPIARIHTAVLAGADPVIMLTAPIPATAEGAAAQRLRLEDIGAFEVNEAFAPVPLAWLAEIGADAEGAQPNGGAIALGHPLGGSGARLMTTLRAPHARQRDPLRAADHVRGRRPGQRHHPRAALGAGPDGEQGPHPGHQGQRPVEHRVVARVGDVHHRQPPGDQAGHLGGHLRADQALLAAEQGDGSGQLGKQLGEQGRVPQKFGSNFQRQPSLSWRSDPRAMCLRT